MILTLLGRLPSNLPLLTFLGAVLITSPTQAFDPQVLDSVVRIKPDWPQADRRGAPRDPQGTGVAILEGGYIATNVHVLGNAKDVEIILNDGRVMNAEIIGKHAPTDIALLRIDADLPAIATAPPPPLGGAVCAVGNQFGLGLSVTCGVVSALNRSGTGFNPIEDFIQTDAGVNPGSSGGALVNARSEMVGLVSAIFGNDGDNNIGVNFAASTALVMRVVTDLATHGRVRPANPGFAVSAIPSPLSAEFGGVMVERIDPNSAAFEAGIEAGDIISRMNGVRVVDASGFDRALFLAPLNTRVTFLVRRGKTEFTAKVTPMPDD